MPIIDEPDRDPSGLIRREPSAYAEPPDEDRQLQRQTARQEAPRYGGPRQQEYDQPPQQTYNPPQQQYSPPQPAYQQPPPVYQQQAYAPQPVYVMPPVQLVYMYSPPPPQVQVYMYSPPPPVVTAWAPANTVIVPNQMAYRTALPYRPAYAYPTARMSYGY